MTGLVRGFMGDNRLPGPERLQIHWLGCGDNLVWSGNRVDLGDFRYELRVQEVLEQQYEVQKRQAAVPKI